MEKQPSWYGLNMLPICDEVLERQLNTSIDQYANLCEVTDKPHVLDKDIVSRIIKSHSQQNEDVWVYFEQCQKWRSLSPSAEEIKLINQVEKNAAKLERINKNIIDLASQIMGKTIDSVVSAKDFDFGLDWLLKTFSKND